jgi:Glycosyl transferase family 2
LRKVHTNVIDATQPCPRCVYICVGRPASQDAVRQTVMLGRSCAGEGHDVVVILDRDTAENHQTEFTGLAVTVLKDGHPGHWYFCTEQAAADRVLDTIMAMTLPDRPSSLYFVDCAHLAAITVQARRLLGIPHADIYAVDYDTIRAATDVLPGTLSEVYVRWAIRYVRRHAQIIRDCAASLASSRHDVVDGTHGNESRSCISVVIPLYNQGDYVHEAISSVTSEGLHTLEIIVVNDGSTDERTNRIFEDLHGVRKVRQNNRGLSAARNAGIAVANGDYVVPLDADDLVAPGFLASARAALDRNRDIAYVVGRARYTGLLNLTYVPAGFIPELNLFIHTHGKAVGMYRKSALDSIGGYDEDFCAFEDWELQVALYRGGYDTDVLPMLSQFYRRHADSMSFTKSNGMREQLVHQLMRKHLLMLNCDDLRTGMLVLSNFWKTAYEPSTSVLLQERVLARHRGHTGQ